MSPKFSIIIPIYNIELYLQECLDSVLAQTIEDFEVIAVDDGSTDESGRILDDYANRDFRITAIHKDNKGVGSARNEGIKKAKGEYLCFVDGDDVLASTYLQVLYDAVGIADSSLGGFKTFGVLVKNSLVVTPETNKIETLEDQLYRFYDIKDRFPQRYIWNRMFKASVIRANQIAFREDIYYKEDGLFLVQYLCRSNGLVGMTSTVVYKYRRTPESATGSVRSCFNEKLISSLSAHKSIIHEVISKRVCSSIIDKARDQALSVSKWLFLLMRQSECSNLKDYVNLEIQTLCVVGFKHYLVFVFSSLPKLLK